MIPSSPIFFLRRIYVVLMLSQQYYYIIIRLTYCTTRVVPSYLRHLSKYVRKQCWVAKQGHIFLLISSSEYVYVYTTSLSLPYIYFPTYSHSCLHAHNNKLRTLTYMYRCMYILWHKFGKILPMKCRHLYVEQFDYIAQIDNNIAYLITYLLACLAQNICVIFCSV